MNKVFKPFVKGAEMIEIIKHGNRPKTDKRVEFKCGRCGCEWVADNAEYRSYIGGMGHEWVSCNCPECDYIDSQDVSEQDGEQSEYRKP